MVFHPAALSAIIV